MFARVTIVFGAVVLAVTGLAAAIGVVATGTATIPALLGGLLILLALLDRPPAAPQAARFQSSSRFPTIVAAALVFDAVHELLLTSDARGSSSAPAAAGLYLGGLVVVGIGYIVFGAASDIAEARRVARARAAAASTLSPARPAGPRRAKRSRR